MALNIFEEVEAQGKRNMLVLQVPPIMTYHYRFLGKEKSRNVIFDHFKEGFYYRMSCDI